MKKIILLIILALTISTANGQSWVYLSTSTNSRPYQFNFGC